MVHRVGVFVARRVLGRDTTLGALAVVTAGVAHVECGTARTTAVVAVVFVSLAFVFGAAVIVLVALVGRTGVGPAAASVLTAADAERDSVQLGVDAATVTAAGEKAESGAGENETVGFGGHGAGSSLTQPQKQRG